MERTRGSASRGFRSDNNSDQGRRDVHAAFGYDRRNYEAYKEEIEAVPKAELIMIHCTGTKTIQKQSDRR